MYALVGIGLVIIALLCIRYRFKRKTAEPARRYNCLTIRLVAAEWEDEHRAVNRTVDGCRFRRNP